MSITKITAWAAGTGFLLMALLASSSANAGVLVPGITDPSTPQFQHNVKIRANRGSWTLQTNNGLKDFTFNDGTNPIWNGDGFKYNFSAKFDQNSGVFLSGSMSIEGSIAGLGIMDKKTTLMSADLTSFGFNAGGSILGFNTTNIVCDAGLGVNCTMSESVLLFVDDLFNGDTLGRYHTTALAITSVPVPAAVWLFGSGLGFMGVIARRRKKQ